MENNNKGKSVMNAEEQKRLTEKEAAKTAVRLGTIGDLMTCAREAMEGGDFSVSLAALMSLETMLHGSLKNAIEMRIIMCQERM